MDYFFDEDDESNENIEVKDDMYNYKGYFVENEEEDEKKFYEFGAHFPYMYLYQRLEIIAQERKEQQKELENKLIEKEKESRDDPATNEESKNNDNLKDLLNIFQQKGKSRNRGDVGIGLTYMPKMNKKDSEHMDIIDNAAINLIKSTNGQNQNENIEKEKKSVNINTNKNKNNVLNINNNWTTNKNNNNKKEKEKSKTKNKTKKNSKFAQQQIKIRKRNDNKLNINNSINSNNTVSINIFNKTKFGDKLNSKNLTHDIPYVSKIKSSLVNKLKSIQNSKEKLRKQILNTGNIEQRLNNKAKINSILNKFRNTNSKWSYSKCFGYQNTKNASSSKNLLTRHKNKKKLMNTKTGISTGYQYGKIGGNNINININFNKTYKNSNISSYNNILSNNILSMKENNFIQNIKNNKKILFNKKYSHKNDQNKIKNNNYKSMVHNKQIAKLSSSQRKKNLEFIENIGIKTSKNNISRNNNNNIPIFNNNLSQNITNKNFHSVNNAYLHNNIKNNKIYNNPMKLNFTNNFSNLTQQIKPKNSSRWKDKNEIYNQISISNANLRKNIPLSGVQKRSTELNFKNNKKSEILKKKINMIDIKEKLKNCISKNKDMKSAINLKEKNEKNSKVNKSKNISLYKNTFFRMGNSKNIEKKNLQSRNRNENSNKEKYKGRINNTLLQSKKKHHININININNQNNIILNKLNNNGINNNSINLCSVRSSANKGVIKYNKDRNLI